MFKRSISALGSRGATCKLCLWCLARAQKLPRISHLQRHEKMACFKDRFLEQAFSSGPRVRILFACMPCPKLFGKLAALTRCRIAGAHFAEKGTDVNLQVGL